MESPLIEKINEINKSSTAINSITKTKKQKAKPFGYQTLTNTRNRKIVQLLKKSNNGVYNHMTAIQLADEFIEKVRKENIRRSQEKRFRDKLLGIHKTRKKVPLGSRTNAKIMEKSMNKISKLYPELNQIEIQKMAEVRMEEIKAQRAKGMREKRARDKLKSKVRKESE